MKRHQTAPPAAVANPFGSSAVVFATEGWWKSVRERIDAIMGEVCKVRIAVEEAGELPPGMLSPGDIQKVTHHLHAAASVTLYHPVKTPTVLAGDLVAMLDAGVKRALRGKGVSP